MMNFFHASEKHQKFALLLLRVVVGVIFIAHGMAKWQTWSATDPNTMTWIMRVLSIVEPLTGAAMILGLFVPIAGLIFVIIMVGAIYVNIVKFNAVFTGGWSYELLILAASVVLKKLGGGMYSLDDMMKAKKGMGGGMSKQPNVPGSRPQM